MSRVGDAIGPVIGAIGLAVSGWLTYLASRFTARQTRRAQSEATQVAVKAQEWGQRDQFIDRLAKRLDSVEARLDDADRREDSLWSHIGTLERHIWQQEPPPPPPRPAL